MKSESFSNWMTDFFRSYYSFRPVNATFIGVHEYDSELPDFTAEGIAALASDMEQLLERSKGIKTQSRLESIDLSLASNFLIVQLGELKSGLFHRRNPALYTSEAIFGLISVCLRDYAAREGRLASMEQRMKAIPNILKTGEFTVRSAPKEWTNEAIRQCDGAIAFLERGTRILLSEWSMSSPSNFSENCETALRAFRGYRDYLSSELLLRDNASYASGREFFNTLLRHGHCLEDMDAEKLASYGMGRFSEHKDVLISETSKLRQDGDWQAVVANLSDHHPSLEGIVPSCEKCWEDCRRVAIERDLVDWPDYPIRYRFIPQYFQEAAPYLYFLYYRSPAPFDDAKVNDYLLSPVDPSLPSEELEQKLRAFNFTVIKHNHVVHHGAIGHHLQNYYAYHCASKIGKVAGVDCASRIAMFCGGMMAEGWATYSTALMDEFGFNSATEHIAELHSQLRLTARAVVDANLQIGRYSFEEAVRFYVKEVGMSSKAAQSEVVKNSMFPGTGAMYLLGVDTIWNTRRTLASRLGDEFNLRRFHNSILSYGSIPVSIIAKEMLGN